MKRLIIFTVMLLIPLIVSAEISFKTGFMIANSEVGGFEFTLPSIEFKLEKSVYKNISLGFGFRKEASWGYDGYYLSLYPIYKIELSKIFFLNTGLGAEWGIASHEYDNYQTVYDESGNLVFHKWVYLKQNFPFPSMIKKGNVGVMYPFATLSSGVKIWKGLSIEAGLKIQALRFGIKSCNFNPTTWSAYNVQDDKVWKVVPSCFVQIGIKLPSNNSKS